MHDEGNEVSQGGNSSLASAGGLLRNLMSDDILSNNFQHSSVGELIKIDEDVDPANNKNDEDLITKVGGNNHHILTSSSNKETT